MNLIRNPRSSQLTPQLFLGVDLGKERDHTVLALRDLVRLPLSTAYTRVPQVIKNTFTRHEADSPYPASVKTDRNVVVDAGGGGGGVLDIIGQAQDTRLLGPLQLVPVFTSSGHEPGHTASGCHTVPRRDLLTALRTNWLAFGKAAKAPPNTTIWPWPSASLSGGPPGTKRTCWSLPPRPSPRQQACHSNPLCCNKGK